MQQLKTKIVIKKLKSNGFEFNRQKGSHMTFKSNTGKIAVIVDSKMQSQGTLRTIEKSSGVKF